MISALKKIFCHSRGGGNPALLLLFNIKTLGPRLRGDDIIMWAASILFFLLSATALAAPTQLQKINLLEVDNITQIQFDFNNKPDYTVIYLNSPLRLIFDVKQARLQAALPMVSADHPLIKDLSQRKQNPNTIRIVIDLKTKLNYKTALKKIPHTGGYRFSFLLSSAAPLSHEEVTAVVEKAAAPVNTPPNKAILTAKTDKPHDLVVVLDAGHGGKDPGARGRLGTQEKDVVIAISRYLQKDLQATPGIKAYLTRTSDTYVPLRERLNIARKYKADIFIAVHADAFRNASARGASIFALSQRGATSESARWLAEQENQSELLGGANLNDKDYVLKSVLLDMSQTNTINSSLNLGHAILGYLKGFTELHSYKVEQAAFVVLKSPDIPSLLVETGFISNPQEERNLRSPSYQQKLALQIRDGILDYFKENTPPNTVFAQQYQK